MRCASIKQGLLLAVVNVSELGPASVWVEEVLGVRTVGVVASQSSIPLDVAVALEVANDGVEKVRTGLVGILVLAELVDPDWVVLGGEAVDLLTDDAVVGTVRVEAVGRQGEPKGECG
ncbi:hypothetical protein IE81DRAFT_236100 [Ceraceosorus guamensis]|uniref:Uncharacterized protein n=1 Tax=Ceraceosorus guamensis TaxID=1522189 RepID=A0A316VV66_9BASI|nr:hypothetical protein IE81DRAFT_236100 [Ceraceosorus guamensis]PWN40191.1 hypothetical protein IE81DRAFT_236100 [Ceraceosorus guamensis]